MADDERVARYRAYARAHRDPAAREQYERLIETARAVTGMTDDDRREVALALTDLVFDIEPRPPVPAVYGLHREAQYYSITFPLIPGDEQMPHRDIRFKYSMLETLAWLRGGIRPTELADLGLDEAWPVISRWVDNTRAGR